MPTGPSSVAATATSRLLRRSCGARRRCRDTRGDTRQSWQPAPRTQCRLRGGLAEPPPRRPGSPRLRKAIPGDGIRSGQRLTPGLLPTRSANENPVWAIHRWATDASASERIEYETDRVRFLGAAVLRAIPPLWTAAVARRRRPARCWIRSSACDAEFASSREAGRIAFVTGAADTREAAPGIAGQFRDLEAIDRAFTTAGTAVTTSCGKCR